MARSLGYRVDGLNQVVRGLLEIGVQVEDLKGAFGPIADMGARTVARFAPKRSGRLSGDARGSRARNKAVVTAGRMALPYAGPINYGWAKRNIEPSMFMQRADEAVRPFALRRLEAEINIQIRRRGLN